MFMSQFLQEIAMCLFFLPLGHRSNSFPKQNKTQNKNKNETKEASSSNPICCLNVLKTGFFVWKRTSFSPIQIKIRAFVGVILQNFTLHAKNIWLEFVSQKYLQNNKNWQHVVYGSLCVWNITKHKHLSLNDKELKFMLDVKLSTRCVTSHATLGHLQFGSFSHCCTLGPEVTSWVVCTTGML